jgi:hypothetical protein
LRHDVRGPADVTLLEAMREAAGRDRVAFQYTSDFTDIFDTGMGTLASARASGWPAPWPVAAVYLAFLAGFPDSHIARKNGPEAAARVQIEALNERETIHECRKSGGNASRSPEFRPASQGLRAKSGNKRGSHRRKSFRGPLNSHLDQPAQ